jgi:hypothetical protein
MTGISSDINAGRAVLERHFDLSLGKLHEIPLNNAHNKVLSSKLITCPLGIGCIAAKQMWHLFMLNIQMVTFHDYVTFYPSFFQG